MTVARSASSIASAPSPSVAFRAAIASASISTRERSSACVGEAIGQSNVLPVKR
jgi:hypothetical protein